MVAKGNQPLGHHHEGPVRVPSQPGFCPQLPSQKTPSSVATTNPEAVVASPVAVSIQPKTTERTDSTTETATNSQPAPQAIDNSNQISKSKPAQGDTSQGTAVVTNGTVDQQDTPAIDTSVTMATPQAHTADGVSTGRLILVAIFALTLSAAAVTAVTVVRERS